MYTVPAENEPDSPWPIFQRLLVTHAALDELHGMMEAGTTLAFMFRFGEWAKHGRGILGMCYCQPSAQGDLRNLFEQLLEDTLGYYPDFLIVLNADWWAAADATERDVLVFHECLHAKQATDRHGSPMFDKETGRPKPALRPHDVEEFNAVAEIYGAWKGDIREFRAALERHDLRTTAKAAEPRKPVVF